LGMMVPLVAAMTLVRKSVRKRTYLAKKLAIVAVENNCFGYLSLLW
jgi:hypothetical protein